MTSQAEATESVQIYQGVLSHRRRSPVNHQFTYPTSLVCIDLDTMTTTSSTPLVPSGWRFSPLRFQRSDYLGDHALPLSESVRQLVRDRLQFQVTGPVLLLTQVRQFGFVFNPISLYYCYSDTSTLIAIVAEVTNTPWGERHCYAIDCRDDPTVVRHECAKQFHVSPFMPMDLLYRWRLTSPGTRATIHLQTTLSGESIFNAVLLLERKPFTWWNVSQMLFRFPAGSAQAVAAIYWQALKLWWKRAPFHPHPDKSDTPPPRLTSSDQRKGSHHPPVPAPHNPS